MLSAWEFRRLPGMDVRDRELIALRERTRGASVEDLRESLLREKRPQDMDILTLVCLMCFDKFWCWYCDRFVAWILWCCCSS